ncbi:hypothetical protein [Sorangium sp. So ce385]|uniref:hypothetical protein n=1 Tax=Sorangium sp. So ce385 TaxID=3133308 RepID=UPI003F5B9437
MAVDERAGGGEVEGGVSLSRYAAVHAALSEGFSLDAALVRERVSLASWGDAEPAWAARLAESAGGDQALLGRYDALLAEARARYSRRIRPIDEDVRAWLGFLRAWSSSGDHLAFLDARGVRFSDIARLQIRWAERIASDAGLREQVLAIAGEPPGPCPEIAVEPGIAAPAEARPSGRPASGPGDRPAPRPSLWTPLPTPGSDSPPLAGTLNGPTPPPAPRAEAAAGAPGASAAGERAEMPAGMRHFQSLRETELGPPGPSGPALPFASAPAVPPEVAFESAKQHAEATQGPRAEPPAQLLAATAPLRGEQPLAATAPLRGEPGGPPLPFSREPGEGAAPAPEVRSGFEMPKGMRRFQSLRETELGSPGPSGPALPFASVPAMPPDVAFESAKQHAEATQGPRAEPPAQPLAATAPLRGEPGGSPLPFLRERAAGAAPAPAAAPEVRSGFEMPAGMRRFQSLRETERASSSPSGPALPFAPPPAAMAPLESGVPSLSLERYAVLCVDLRRFPEQGSEILRRHGLTAEQRADLDTHWHKRMAEEPAVRLAWERACEAYAARTAGPR